MKTAKYIICLILISSCASLSIKNPHDDIVPSWKVSSMVDFIKLNGTIQYFYPGDEYAQFNKDKTTLWGISMLRRVNNESEIIPFFKNFLRNSSPGVCFVKTDKFPILNIKSNDNNSLLTPVTWQHKNGIVTRGFNGNRFLTNSLRLNRCNSSAQNINFSVKLNPNEYFKNNPFRIRFKANINDASDSTFVELDCRGFNMKGKSNFIYSINKVGWNEYEFSGQIPSNTFSTRLRFYRPGIGSLFLDDVKIDIIKEGKEIPFVLKNSDFEKYDTTKKRFENYWGVGPDYKESIKPIISTTPNYNQYVEIEGLNNVELYAEPKKIGDHYIEKLYNDSLIAIPLVMPGNKKLTPNNIIDKPSTLPILIDDRDSLYKVLNKRFNEEGRFSNTDSLLFEIGKVWNIIEHSFPYFTDVQKAEWQTVLSRAVEMTLNPKSHNLTHFEIINWMLSFLKDPHCALTRNNTTKKHLPFEMRFIEDKAVVTKIFIENSTLKKGDIIEKIDGVNVLTEIRRLNEIYDFGNQKYTINVLLKKLLIVYNIEKEYCTIETSDGHTRSINLLNSRDFNNLKDEFSQEKFELEKISNDIVYINNSLKKLLGKGKPSTVKINNLIKDVNQYKYVVIDARKGDNGWGLVSLLSTLKTKKEVSSNIDQTSIIPYPHQYNMTFSKSDLLLEGKLSGLDTTFAKIVVLVDDRTLSAPERSILPYYDADEILLIGEKTAGSCALSSKIKVNENINVTFTTSKVTHSDSTAVQGIGIIPHYEVSPTIENIKENKDPALEKAIEIINTELNDNNK